MDALRNAKQRFHATVSYIVDTGWRMLRISVGLSFSNLPSYWRLTMGTVHKYNQVMKGLPLNYLLSSTNLDKVHESLTLIFSYLSWKLTLSPYTICQVLPLVKVISRDFSSRRPSLHLNIPPNSIPTLPRLRTSTRTNDGPRDIQNVRWSHQRVHERHEGGDEEEEWEVHSDKGCSSVWKAGGTGEVFEGVDKAVWAVGCYGGSDDGVGGSPCRRGRCRGGMYMEEVKKAYELLSRLMFWMLVLVSRFLSFLSLFLGKG